MISTSAANRHYLDYNATAPCSSEHYKELCSLLCECDGNASSVHKEGRKARAAVEDARAAIAALLGAPPQTVFFTSGATEANNWAVRGAVDPKAMQATRIIMSAGEHSSVRRPMQDLNELGCDLFIAPLLPDGRINASALLENVAASTRLVAMIHVQNEVGAVNDLKALAAEIKKINPSTHVHADCVQALGKVDLSWVHASPLDSIALSAHKVGGLKGVGCLYKKPSSRLSPLMTGGSQEAGQRPGTLNVPGICSFGLRATAIVKNPRWLAHLEPLADQLRNGLAQIPGVRVHSNAECLPTTTNFLVEKVESAAVMLRCDMAGIALSAGPACSSGAPTPSPTLISMGLNAWEAINSVRASLGEGSTADDVLALLKVIREVAKR